MKNGFGKIVSSRVERIFSHLSQSFKISLGSNEAIDNLLFKIELDDGTVGYGEAGILTCVTGETYEDTCRNLNKITAFLLERNINEYLEIFNYINLNFSNNHAAVTAVEMALLDALTRSVGVPLWKYFGNAKKPVRTDMTIVISDPDNSACQAEEIYHKGIRAFKVKVGNDVDEDVQRLIMIHRASMGLPIYIDANQGYTPDVTIDFLKKMKDNAIDISLVEQPVHCNDLEGLKYIRERIDIPVCADESVFTVTDAIKVIKMNACDVVNIKIMKSGIMQALEIGRICKASGLKLMIGGMVESLLAMGCSAHMAYGTGFFDYIDLDMPFFIKDDLMDGNILKSDGFYDLSGVISGIGVVPRFGNEKPREL